MNRGAVMYDSYGSSSISPDVITSHFDYHFYKLKNFFYSEIMTYRFIALASKRIVSKFYQDDSKIVSPYDPKVHHLKNYFTSKYIKQIKNIINFCKKNNIKVILIKEAHYLDLAYQASLKPLSKEQIIDKLLNYQNETNVDKTKRFWIYTNEILNKSFDEIKLDNPSIVLVDPTKELYKYKKEINFSDNIHLTSHGNELIADEIMLSIIENFNLLSSAS